MLLYTILSKNKGWNYSSLIVTYPIASSPTDAMALAIKATEAFYSPKLQSYNIRSGEIPTTLPFKAVKSIHIKKSNGLLVLANDEFMECTSNDILFETKSIILAVQENQQVKLVDGLAYLLNELDKFHVSPKRFDIVPYLYTMSTPTSKFLENIRDETYFNATSLCQTSTNLHELDRNHQLTFITMANQYFRNKPSGLMILERSNRYDPRNKILQKLLSNNNITLCVNLKNSVDILRTEPSKKPNIADNFLANDLLLRSIIIANWINNPTNTEEKRRGSKLASKYSLPLVSWKEALEVRIWTNQWDEIAWTGKRSLVFLKKAQNELPNIKPVISLINRRGFLILFFPVLCMVSAAAWIKSSLDFQNFFPFVALSLFLGILGPLFSINAFYRLARIDKMARYFRYFWAASFMLSGMAISRFGIQVKAVYVIYALSAIVITWLSWCLIPMSPRIGKVIFRLVLLSIPLSSFALGKLKWENYFSGLEKYKDINLVVEQILEGLSFLVNLFLRFLSSVQ